MSVFNGITDRRKYYIFEISIFFVIFYLPGIFPSASWPSNQIPGFRLPHVWIWLTAGIEISVILMSIRWFHRQSFACFGMVGFRFGFLPAASAVAAVLAAIMIGTTYLSGFFHAPGWNTVPEAVQSPFPQFRSLLLLVVSSLITGYREELFFRSFMLTGLREAGAGTAAAIIAGSCLFASLHAYAGPAGIVGSFLSGLFLSAVFIGIRNLHTAALGHGLYNAFAAILPYVVRNIPAA